jgi:hypothetical protein
MNYIKDGAKYSVRDNAKSPKGPTADFYKPGSGRPDAKLRLEPALKPDVTPGVTP